MEKLTREEIEMCEIAVGIVIDRLDLTSENKAKWEALFDRLEVLQRETCLTPLAPDAANESAKFDMCIHGFVRAWCAACSSRR